MKIDDFLRWPMAHQVVSAPDRDAIIFSVKEGNEKQNRYDANLWVYDPKHQKAHALTAGNADHSPLFLPDGRLLFLSDRKREGASDSKQSSKLEKTSFYAMPLDGGEATFAFSLALSVDDIELINKTEGRYALVLGHYDLGRDEDWTEIEDLPFWFNGLGYISGTVYGLYLLDLEKAQSAVFEDTAKEKASDRSDAPEDVAEKEAKKHDAALGLTLLTPMEQTVSGFAIAGNTVFFTASQAGGYQETKETIYTLSLSDAIEGRPVTPNKMTDPYQVHGLVPIEGRREASADATYLIAAEGTRYGDNENPFIAKVEADGTWTAISRPDFDTSVGSSVGSDARAEGGCVAKATKDGLLFIQTKETRAVLSLLSDDGSVTDWTGEGMTVESFDVAPDGTLYLIAMEDGKLAELYRMENPGRADASLEKLTNFSEALPTIQPVESFFFDANGEKLEGFVIRPADFDPDRNYPGLLWIHGGPKTVLGRSLFHEMQWLASEGYFVFFTNPHGSDGYGAEYADIRGKYGAIDYEDLMVFTDAVLEKYPQIDAKCIGVLGGSYGGFMTNWIIGHTNRFAAANAQRSISNWISFYGVSDIGTTFAEDQTKGNPWTSLDVMWNESPLKYANRVTTPTLFIHAEEDYRCPLEQGVQMYATLKKNGIPSRLVTFKGENHELSRSGRPKGRLKRLSEIKAWFDRYLK